MIKVSVHKKPKLAELPPRRSRKAALSGWKRRLIIQRYLWKTQNNRAIFVSDSERQQRGFLNRICHFSFRELFFPSLIKDIIENEW